jgi:hypothetical protein
MIKNISNNFGLLLGHFRVVLYEKQRKRHFAEILIFLDFQALRQNILQLLTPIAMTHTIVFLASVADVWNTKKLTEKDFETKSHFFLAVSDDQLRVISLVLDIKVIYTYFICP